MEAAMPNDKSKTAYLKPEIIAGDSSTPASLAIKP